MTPCYTNGALRAYLDGELAEAETRTLAAHLDECAECGARLDELKRLDTTVRSSFIALSSDGPAADEALAALRARLPETSRRAGVASPITRLSQVGRSRRTAVGSAVAAALLLVVLIVPGARAAAGSLLQMFRAQSVVYVSVSPSRIEQLKSLNVDAHALFISKPEPIGTPPTAQQVDSAKAASAITSFTPGAVTIFPSGPTTTTYAVMPASAYRMQVNVKTLQQVLTALGVTDVRIPESLGAQPLTVSLPASVETQYTGSGYAATLIEGTSPTVNLPSDVNLTTLGQAVLEVYGMDSKQASALSKTIDWRSTLVFPFPVGTSKIQQVQVNGVQGVLLNATENVSQSGQSGRAAPSYIIYWQKGDHFYMLRVQGGAVGATAALAMADSVR